MRTLMNLDDDESLDENLDENLDVSALCLSLAAQQRDLSVV